MSQDVDVLARPHLLLVSDPMCSWCYAFAPVSQQLAAHYAQRLTMRLVTPGMRNNPEPMPAEKRQGLLQMLHKVRDASGGPSPACSGWPTAPWPSIPSPPAGCCWRRAKPRATPLPWT